MILSFLWGKLKAPMFLQPSQITYHKRLGFTPSLHGSCLLVLAHSKFLLCSLMPSQFRIPCYTQGIPYKIVKNPADHWLSLGPFRVISPSPSDWGNKIPHDPLVQHDVHHEMAMLWLCLMMFRAIYPAFGEKKHHLPITHCIARSLHILLPMLPDFSGFLVRVIAAYPKTAKDVNGLLANY